jgi:hypothetical protein
LSQASAKISSRFHRTVDVDVQFGFRHVLRLTIRLIQKRCSLLAAPQHVAQFKHSFLPGLHDVQHSKCNHATVVLWLAKTMMLSTRDPGIIDLSENKQLIKQNDDAG